jgi:hypothetical protein
MALFDSLFGGDAAADAQASINEATARGEGLVREGLSRARMDRARSLGPLFREIQTLRAIRDFRDPLTNRANLEAIRARAGSETRASQRAAGLTGPQVLGLNAAGANFLSSALDATSSAQIRRFESTTQLLAGLASTAGQITSAGSNTEIQALSGLADRSIAAAAAIGQANISAESSRFGAIFGAFGGAIGGFAAGGFFNPEVE